jgi:hypothetical protein
LEKLEKSPVTVTRHGLIVSIQDDQQSENLWKNKEWRRELALGAVAKETLTRLSSSSSIFKLMQVCAACTTCKGGLLNSSVNSIKSIFVEE